MAHAIERMITQVVTASGYNYLTIDNNQNVFHCKGVKNLYQYNEKTKQQCIDELMQYDIITFDIFDTLISRKTISPSTIFDILEKNVEKKYKIENFKALRQNAEYNVRVEKNFIGDCSIDEIYSNLEKTISLEKKEIEKIKEMEIELEIKFAIPKRDMLEIFNHLVDNNKKIILISDMYLTSEIIEKMLNKCGYKGWNKLLVSSEVGLRKDNGTIWDYYFNDIAKDKKTIHVGDNEQSDVQQLCDLGKPFYHVMQAKKMFQLSDYSIYTNNNCNILTTNDKIVQGLIINNCLYNSPFKKTDEEIINNFHDFGYSIFGPIFIKYMNFLQKNMIENKYNKILFLAREGYYLQKIYKKYCSIFNQKEIKNYYFYTSRRATSVACIENKEDAKQILSTGYEGNLRNLFKNRLGIEDKNIDDIFVKTSENMDKINETLENIYGNHKKQFEQEKKEYLKYCKKYISKQEKIAISDLGYSGTIQYYLMKLLDKKMDGYYFTLSDNLKPEKIGGKCYGCFDSKKENIEKNIFLFSMILETFLTAPYGQLIKMEKDKPVYRDENIDEELIKNLDEIYEGIIDFMNDISGISENILDFEISNEFICSNFSSLVYVDEVLSQKIKKIFVLDNSYSLDGKINVFDYFNIVYRKNR